MELQINLEKKELKTHGSYEFPLLVSYEKLSNFETGSFPWHWHPEIELTLIQKGEIIYQVNDNRYHLREGEGLFCNTNVLHSGHGILDGDCQYLSVTFHPRLLYGYSSSCMQTKYMNHILKNPAMYSIHFTGKNLWQKEILERIEKLRILKEEALCSFELQMQITLLEIWQRIYENVEMKEVVEHGRDIERIRQILQYIQKHYTENITLEDLAKQIHICKSESCRLFKRYMNETMFSYLLDYRIERSLELLRQTDSSVTQIAGSVGFVNAGYYARIFRRKMGCSPLEYRKNKKQ